MQPTRPPHRRPSHLRLRFGTLVLAATLMALQAHSSGAGTADAPFIAPETAAMGARLQRIAKETDPLDDVFLNAERAKMLRNALEHTPPGNQRITQQMLYAQELLNAGESLKALEEFDRWKAEYARAHIRFGSKEEVLLRHFKAICYLRLGEQENCILNHTSASCLFPITGAGVHKLRRGSEGALEILSEQLARSTSDLQSRWLANIAAMTLGQYPGELNPAWVIPPEKFASEFDPGRFPEIAPQVGLNVRSLAGGSVLDDFDRDGDLDLMISSWGLSDPLRLFWNQGDGTFTDGTASAGLTGETGGLNLIQADYNNDGFIDVLVLRGAWLEKAGNIPNSLLRNNGDGTFTDVTESAGLLTFHPTQTATWLDFDGDGWLDLFIGNESLGNLIHPCELFRNRGDGTFTECAAACGLTAANGFVKAVISGDYNNDGRPDLYVSRLGEPNLLFRNDGPKPGQADAKIMWRFSEVSQQAGVRDPLYSFPGWFWDYDNDGWLDIFVAGYNMGDPGNIAADYLGLPHRGERARLFHNDHDGTFSDVSHQTKVDKLLLAMGANFGDIDNDGYLDFYLGTGDPDLASLMPNRMFRNSEGRFFQDVTTAGGFGHLQKGHGISFGDIDNDGDQDIYEVMGGAYAGDLYGNVLYLNPGHGGHWIALQLEGKKANRAGIGARIRLSIKTAAGGTRQICRTVTSGGSFGASPLRQEIGLGNAESVEKLTVEWPGSGTRQSFKNPAFDTAYTVREDQPGLQTLVRHRIPLSDKPMAGMAHPHH